MGRRELLLIFAFIVVGAVVYQLTAPPAKPGSRGFSLRHLLQEVRTEISGGSRSEAKSTARLEAGAEIQALIISRVRGAVSVVGEDRSDVEVELTAEASAAEPAEAEALVREMAPQLAASGDAMTVSVKLPPDLRRYRTDLALKVPKRLRVRLEAVGRVEVRDVAEADVNVTRGDVVIRDVKGPVRGEHRDGDLEITGVSSLRMVTRRSDVRLERIAGATFVEATDGALRARAISGELRVEGRRLEIDIDEASGEIQITHSDGRVTIRNARAPVRVEGRRSRISLALGEAVPVTAASTDGPLEIFLPPTGGVSIDALVTGGKIRSDVPGVSISGDEAEQRASGNVGGGGAMLNLRNGRGDIIIRNADKPTGK